MDSQQKDITSADATDDVIVVSDSTIAQQIFIVPSDSSSDDDDDDASSNESTDSSEPTEVVTAARPKRMTRTKKSQPNKSNEAAATEVLSSDDEDEGVIVETPIISNVTDNTASALAASPPAPPLEQPPCSAEAMENISESIIEHAPPAEAMESISESIVKQAPPAEALENITQSIVNAPINPIPDVVEPMESADEPPIALLEEPSAPSVNTSGLGLLANYGTGDSDESDANDDDDGNANKTCATVPHDVAIEKLNKFIENGDYRIISDSSEESDDDDDGESDVESVNATGANKVADDGDDSDVEFVKVTKEMVKARGELGIDDLPPIEDLKITVPEDECVVLGKIFSVVEQLGKKKKIQFFSACIHLLIVHLFISFGRFFAWHGAIGFGHCSVLGQRPSTTGTSVRCARSNLRTALLCALQFQPGNLGQRFNGGHGRLCGATHRTHDLHNIGQSNEEQGMRCKLGA